MAKATSRSRLNGRKKPARATSSAKLATKRKPRSGAKLKGKATIDVVEDDEVTDPCDCPEGEECDCDDEIDGEDEPVRTMGDGKSILAGRKQAARFVKAFGERGVRWFAEGKTIAEAQVLFGAEMKLENQRLQKEHDRLSVAIMEWFGEAEPVSGGDGDGPRDGGRGGRSAGGVSGQNLSPGAAKFAASMDLPGRRR